MYDLPVNRATDIAIRENGLADPFMKPSEEGHSVYPVEGTVYNMQIPVTMTGEVDGIVYTYDAETGQKTPASYQNVQLLPLDDPAGKPISVKAERDGYFISYMIPPGDYLLMTEEKKNYGNVPPQIVTIGLDGTILRDQNIEVVKGGYYVPYEVVYNSRESIPAGTKSYSQMLRVKKSGKSDLSATIFRMINQQTEDLYAGLVKLQELDREDGDYDYYTAVETENFQDPAYLHNICGVMREKLADCTVVVNATLGTKE